MGKISPLNPTIGELYQFLKKKFPNGEFKLGISNEGHDIKEAVTYFEEAIDCLKVNFAKKYDFVRFIRNRRCLN